MGREDDERLRRYLEWEEGVRGMVTGDAETSTAMRRYRFLQQQLDGLAHADEAQQDFVLDFMDVVWRMLTRAERLQLNRESEAALRRVRELAEE